MSTDTIPEKAEHVPWVFRADTPPGTIAFEAVCSCGWACRCAGSLSFAEERADRHVAAFVVPADPFERL